MKKLKSLNLGQSLNRQEMKNINGGGEHPNLSDSDCPSDTCSKDGDCGVKSYCANTTCTISPGYQSSFNSCQWLK